MTKQAAALEAENRKLGELCREQGLQERAVLAAIVQSSEDAIISKTLDGIIRTWNAGAERIFGYRASEAVGRPIAMLIPADRLDEEAMILNRLRGGERIEQYETVRVARDGRQLEVSLSIAPLRDESGKIVGASKIARDITLQKRAERELEQARLAAEAANRAKDRFLAVLSHELRTPLTPVLTGLTLLEKEPGIAPDLREEIIGLRRNVEAEARLIDDLLELTGMGRQRADMHFEVVDMHAMLHKTVTGCETEIESKDLEVSMVLAAAQHQVWADMQQLQQVLTRLIRNAVRFSSPQGPVVLRTSNPSGGRFQLEVTDHGAGIDAEAMPHIFEAFAQSAEQVPRRVGGLGLGLLIARGIVELHQGSLTAASDGPNQGATFTLLLPTTTVPPATRRWDEPVVRGAGVQHKRILLVEDHPDTLRLMTRVLASFGYEIKTATGVQAALELLEKEEFDLLVSDIGLPDGSGLEIMQHVSHDVKGAPPLKAIAVSGFGTPDDIRRSQEVGFTMHLTKPVNPDILETVLHTISS